MPNQANRNFFFKKKIGKEKEEEEKVERRGKGKGNGTEKEKEKEPSAFSDSAEGSSAFFSVETACSDSGFPFSSCPFKVSSGPRGWESWVF